MQSGFPLWVQAALGSIIRWALASVAGYFVGKGVWTNEDASSYVGYATLGALTLLWSLWQKRGALKRYFTALASHAGTTDSQVRSLLAQGVGVKATLKPDDVPYLR